MSVSMSLEMTLAYSLVAYAFFMVGIDLKKGKGGSFMSFINGTWVERVGRATNRPAPFSSPLQRIRSWLERRLMRTVTHAPNVSLSSRLNMPPFDQRLRALLLHRGRRHGNDLARTFAAFQDILLLYRLSCYEDVLRRLDEDFIDIVVIDAISRQNIADDFHKIRDLRRSNPNTQVIAIQAEHFTVIERAMLLASGAMLCLRKRPGREYLYQAIHQATRERTVLDHELAHFVYERFHRSAEHASALTDEESWLLCAIARGHVSDEAIANELNSRHLGNVVLKFATRFGPQVECNLKKQMAPFADFGGTNLLPGYRMVVDAARRGVTPIDQTGSARPGAHYAARTLHTLRELGQRFQGLFHPSHKEHQDWRSLGHKCL